MWGRTKLLKFGLRVAAWINRPCGQCGAGKALGTERGIGA